MLSALLPGVREFRTPLVTGLLWAATLYLFVGRPIADSDATSEFVRSFRLDVLPPTAWFAAATLLIYLFGSLLVVRASPMGKMARRWRLWLMRKVDRLDERRVPEKRRHRWVWNLWHNHNRNVVQRRVAEIREVAWRFAHGYDPSDNTVHAWLHNEFTAMCADGRVPVMRSFDGGCMAPSGFEGFYTADSINNHPGYPDGTSLRAGLADGFVREVKNEKAAVEARIQMRFPDVYAEIDRLKVEAELRMSIFWPLVILSVVLGVAWSPVALVGLLAPPLLLRDGYKRSREATEKTWGALVAGEVSSPILDAMKADLPGDCRDFDRRYNPPEQESRSLPQDDAHSEVAGQN